MITFTKSIIAFFLTAFLLVSCDKIEDGVLPVTGIYEAHVVGVDGPFSINVSAAGDDDIDIEAPFDGFIWSVITADLDHLDASKIEIDIKSQSIAPDVIIKGNGFYFDGTMQLDYEIQFNGTRQKYKLVGSHY